MSCVLLRALHNTRDLQLYVPSEGRGVSCFHKLELEEIATLQYIIAVLLSVTFFIRVLFNQSLVFVIFLGSTHALCAIVRNTIVSPSRLVELLELTLIVCKKIASSQTLTIFSTIQLNECHHSQEFTVIPIYFICSSVLAIVGPMQMQV